MTFEDNAVFFYAHCAQLSVKEVGEANYDSYVGEYVSSENITVLENEDCLVGEIWRSDYLEKIGVDFNVLENGYLYQSVPLIDGVYDIDVFVSNYGGLKNYSLAHYCIVYFMANNKMFDFYALYQEHLNYFDRLYLQFEHSKDKLLIHMREVRNF